MSFFQRLKKWAQAIFGTWSLPVIFLFESFIFIPLDFLIAAFSYHYKDKAYRVAFFCALASALAGLVSYSIGYFAWEAIGMKMLRAFGGLDFVNRIALFLGSTQRLFLFVFVGAIVPVPTKIITITCGFLKMDLKVFFIAILLARIVRFLAISYFSVRFGHRVEAFLRRLWPS